MILKQYIVKVAPFVAYVEATFDPPLTESDWRELLPPDDSLLVWHPQLGLVRFETQQQLRVADLCCPPERRAVDWSHAQLGSALNRRLYTLQAEAPPQSVDEIIRGGQEDIGTQSSQLRKLPRSPNEPSRVNWKMIAAAPLLPIAVVAGWLSNLIPKSESGSQFMAKVVSWLDRIASKLPHIMQEREREIQRLLDTLKNDPDEGLKYALPMSDVQGRGVADPGSRLTQRNVDFHLGSSDGGPVDSWSIEAALQAQLMQSYQEAAAREVRLGRFRRAAYIYASLLGNHQAAAHALEQGRFYHEAAAVYREKLKRPVDAARCFENGGLLQEAIEIYQDLKQHVKVGELYERLECPEEARTAFQWAVDERLGQSDRLGAATLQDQRLHDVEAAMTTLEAGWPASSQANQCLERFFAMTSSLGLQLRALAKIETVRQQPISQRQQVDLVGTLSRVAVTHLDGTAAERAADATRVLAARVLSRSPDSPSVLRAVSDLAKDDLLLGRDCRQFQGLNPPPKVSVQPRRASTQNVTGQLDGTIPLQNGFHWLQGESVGAHFYLVGHDSNQTLLLLRGCWDRVGRIAQSVSWSGRGIGHSQLSVMLSCDLQDKFCVCIAQHSCPPFPPRLLPSTDDFPRPIMAESPGWLPIDAMAMASNPLATFVCNFMGELTQYDRQGNLMRIFQLEDEDRDTSFTDTLPVIHARPRDVYVGYGTTLYRISESDQRQTLQFPSRITGISGSRPHTRERILVTHETGAYLLSPTVHSFGETMIEEQTTDLLGCILDDGRAVLWRPGGAYSGDLLVYSACGSRVEFQGATPRKYPRPSPPESPRGGIRLLLPTKTRNQVALIPTGPGSPMELWSFPGD